METRESAWRWAIDTLLPKASKTTVLGLYHYDRNYKTDPQSNATVGK